MGILADFIYYCNAVSCWVDLILFNRGVRFVKRLNVSCHLAIGVKIKSHIFVFRA